MWAVKGKVISNLFTVLVVGFMVNVNGAISSATAFRSKGIFNLNYLKNFASKKVIAGDIVVATDSSINLLFVSNVLS